MKKLCRFGLKGNRDVRYGLLEGEALLPIADNNPFGPLDPGTETIPLSEARLLIPVTPSKIVCVGRNYLEHAAELGNKMPSEPLLFLKPPSSLLADGGAIVLPQQSLQVEHEGEIGVVIKKTATHLSDNDDPFEYVLGYTCVNDVTARDLQRKDVQFTRAKSFDTFCPVGPYVAIDVDPQALWVETHVNGVLKQHGSVDQMAFSIATIIRYISTIMTLAPGDLIASGTPAGVSKLSAGDTVEVTVGSVGTLRNMVVERQPDATRMADHSL